MSTLILVRHGKSEWNKLGLWTGWTDVNLAPEGLEEARRTGAMLKDFVIHEAHVSALKRAQQTLTEIKSVIGHDDASLPTTAHHALNERHYGVHTGKNKWDLKKELGDDTFHSMRRNWDHPIPEGESLKDVYARVIPYYLNVIHPALCVGKNILVVAHGNSLRALVKHVENISDTDIAQVEIRTAEAICYTLSETGEFVCKTHLTSP